MPVPGSYGKKYSQRFKDNRDVQYLIEVYKDGYVGGVTATDGDGVPISIRWQASDMFDHIFASEAKWKPQSKTDFAYTEFFTSIIYGEFIITLIEDPDGTPQIRWLGYNDPDTYQEPFISTPYPTSIKFTDGLARLAKIRWNDSGTLFSGAMHQLGVLRRALNLLPSQRNIREYINVYETTFNELVADSPINQAFITSEYYRETETKGDDTIERAMSCFEVLKRVLSPYKPIRIFTWNDQWHIQRIPEIAFTDLEWREFEPEVGNEDATTVFANNTDSDRIRDFAQAEGRAANELVWLGHSTNIELHPRIEKLKVTYITEGLFLDGGNIALDHRFEFLTTNAGGFNEPIFWTPGSGIDFDTYQSVLITGEDPWAVAIDGNVFVWQNSDVDGLTALDSTKYIESTTTNVNVGTSDTLSFEFGYKYIIEEDFQLNGTITEYGAMVNFLKFDFEITFECELQVGTQYLIGDNDSGYSWQASPGTFKIFQRHPKYTRNGWPATFARSVIETPTIPIDGSVDVRLRIYTPYSNLQPFADLYPALILDTDQVQMGLVSLFYRPDAGDPVEIVEVTAATNEDAIEETFEIFHGDGPSGVSQASIRRANGDITQTWNRRDEVSTQPILELVVDEIITHRDEFIHIHTGKFDGFLEPQEAVRNIVGADLRESMIGTMEWNVRAAEYNSVELFQLEKATIVGLTIDDHIVLTNTRGTDEGSLPPLRTEPGSTRSIPLGDDVALGGEVDYRVLTTYPT